MKFSITHSTTYRYARPVQLARHVFRLRPRCDGGLQLIHYDIQIHPPPAALSHSLDLQGNTVTHAWFDGKTERLSVISHSEIETLRKNGFDYILDPSVRSLPLQYPSHLDSLLAPYVSRIESGDLVEQFTQELVRQAGGDTLKFLDALNHRVHQTCSHVIRETGMPQTSELTLQDGRGSCRDLTMVFIDACRIVGIAARFVSGYRRYSRIVERRYMHAWPEVFLPGGGWRGYDPSYDEPVIDLHVAVAASYEPAGAAPIEGAYFGESVPSTMEVNLEIGDVA